MYQEKVAGSVIFTIEPREIPGYKSPDGFHKANLLEQNEMSNWFILTDCGWRKPENVELTLFGIVFNNQQGLYTKKWKE